jgi:probable F420-dependent oxidoreductase
MKFGLAPPNYARWFDAGTAKRVCVTAEEMGFDSLWFGDHIALPKDKADVFGNAYLDVFALLGFVAGVTSRIRLGTNVVVLPYRNPVVTAKLVATVDVLSGGRVDLGIGVGHVVGEFEALGVPFRDRGAMSDEFLRAMRVLWSQDCASYSGRWVSFQDLCPLTRPVQQPLPLLIGGDGPRSMRRALEFGAGWAPGQGTIEQLRAKVATLRELAAAACRACPRIVARWLVHPIAAGAQRPPIPHSGELRRARLEPGEAREQIAQIRELGVDEVIIDIPARAATYAANMEFAASLIHD